MKIKISVNESSSDFAKEVEERSGIKVRECYQCGKCTAGCPVAYGRMPGSLRDGLHAESNH